MSKIEKVGECPICDINLYPSKRGPFTFRDKLLAGFPAKMPCGINRPGVEGRCPFESEEEQKKINYDRGMKMLENPNKA